MSALSNEDQVKLAKALANTSKDVRDKTVSELNNFFSSLSKLSLLEMRKLWKALYFCLWLSDKTPIQLELAKSLAHLLHSFKKKKLKLMYLRIFYRTLLQQWGKLDQYRINKFYSLVRYMLRETIQMLAKLNWPVEFSKDVFSVMESEILTKQPNGLRFHIADIFLEEIHEATEGHITTDHFILCLQPFLVALGSADDRVYHERLSKKVFSAFITQYAKENKSNPEAVNIFINVNTETIQKLIFEVASSNEGTKDSYRQRIYALHKEFQLKTKKQFITPEGSKENNNSNNKTIHSESSSSSNSKKKSDETMTAIIMEVDDSSNSATKKTEKKRKSMTIDPSTVINAHSTTNDTNTSSNTTTTSSTTNDANNSSNLVNSITSPLLPGPFDDVPTTTTTTTTTSSDSERKTKKQKKKHNKESTSTPIEDIPTAVSTTTSTTRSDPPTTIINSVLQTISSSPTPVNTATETNQTTKIKKKENTTTTTTLLASNSTTTTSTANNNNNVVVENQTTVPPSFILSKKFAGAKSGYFFKNDKLGLGYYKDPKYKTNSKKNSSNANSSSSSSSSNDSNNNKKDKKLSKPIGIPPVTVTQKVQSDNKGDNNNNSNNNIIQQHQSPPPEFRKVHFGALQSKDYQSSVEDLKSATPVLVSTPPGKSALKVKDGSLTGPPKKKKGTLKVDDNQTNKSSGGLFRSSSTGTL